MEIITKGQAFAKGLKTFFTGQACNHGHVAARLVFNGKCCECIRIERERTKQRFGTGNRIVLGRLSVQQPEPAPVEAPRVVEPPPPKPLPDLQYCLPVDPSIQHLFDRGLNHIPLRARPGCGLADTEKPKRAKSADQTGGSKRVAANTDTVEPARTRKPKREEMYGPFRPRGNPNWYKKRAERAAAAPVAPVSVPPPPSIVTQATAPKPDQRSKDEVRRIKQRTEAQQRAQAKMDRLMQFASGNW